MPHKTYNTPKRKCVVKTRLTEDERRAFEDKCAALSMSQSEYIRQAVFYSRISPVIRVTAHSEEMLTAISSLVAQYGKIGSNLNQIARYLNEYGAPYNALSSEVRAAVSDLAASFEGRNEYISRLCRYPLLILDDFGMERDTAYGLEQVYSVIDSRYRSRRPLIVTTNLTLQQIQNPTDTAYARIYDRLLEMCAPVRFTGGNFRRETAQAKLERLKNLMNE